jgi:nucleotide-binding universal stress UspA family protein
MILIAYDGSPDAQAAIQRAGQLFPDQPAAVLTVWEPFEDVVARSGAIGALGGFDYEAVNREYEQHSRARAEEGAQRAQEAGLQAEALIRLRNGSVPRAILDEAEDIGAEAIVLGSRGLTGVKSLLLGSVSHAVLQHADRPVIVVPSPEVASERAAQRR